MQGLCALSDNSMGAVTKRKIEATILEAWSVARDSGLIPYRTGNLRFNAFQLKRTGVNSWQILIKHSVAPYDIYVNGKWVSPKWHGKENPNEGFWQEVCDFIINYIHVKLGGELTNDN